MAEPEELSEAERGTYMGSAALALLLQRLDDRGLLEGEVRESVKQSLVEFRQYRAHDPNRTWHTDLYDLYENVVGEPPPEAE